MGPGWGVTLRKPHGWPWKPRPPHHTKSLLIGVFRVFAWRIVLALAPPVTPEVAGSSPVAPVFQSACKWVLYVVQRGTSSAIHPAHIPHV
jgi:hypothetical protein